MCGLSGAYGAIGKPEVGAFNTLQMFAQLRGKDSTGVGLIYANKKRKPDVLKSVGGQESLAIENTAHFDQLSWALLDKNLLCVIGHNRWATVGVVNEENAHPFHVKNIIGCHNGTIPVYDMRHLDKHNYGKTDSQILFEELGEGKSIADTVKFLPGAWALTWYDTKKRELHMCRNKERTLFVAKSKSGKVLFWASESWMLSIALARSGVAHEEILSVVAGQHLVWKQKGDGTVYLEEVNDAPGGKLPSLDKKWGIADWFRGNKNKKKSVPALPASQSNVVPIHAEEDFEEDYVNTYGKRYLSRRRFESLIKDGCSNCTGDLSWEDRKMVVWLDEESPVCKDCADYLAGKKEVC